VVLGLARLISRSQATCHHLLLGGRSQICGSLSSGVFLLGEIILYYAIIQNILIENSEFGRFSPMFFEVIPRRNHFEISGQRLQIIVRQKSFGQSLNMT
jgi:hypothetical protein